MGPAAASLTKTPDARPKAVFATVRDVGCAIWSEAYCASWPQPARPTSCRLAKGVRGSLGQRPISFGQMV